MVMINKNSMPGNTGSENKGQRELIESGSIQGACVQILDLGWQATSFIAADHDLSTKDGKKIQHELRLTFEVDQQVKEGKFAGDNMLISTSVNINRGPQSAINNLCNTWLDFDFHGAIMNGESVNMETLMVVKHALLTVTHKVGRDNIVRAELKHSGIAKLPKVMEKMETRIDMTKVPLPKWIEAKIANQLTQEEVEKLNPERFGK